MRSNDDLSTAARIRHAAISEFATNGVDGTSIRTIAKVAGVSPGSVIHHFGSKDDLRVACDEHVAAVIRAVKQSAMASGGGFDPIATFQAAGDIPAAKYLARTVVDGSPHVAELVDEMVNDAVQYVETGVESGMIKPSEHERERAAVLTIWSLGALVLHEHLERLIGVDLTAADLGNDPQAGAAYMAPALEIFGQGVFTEQAVRAMREAFVAAQNDNENKEKESA